MLSHYVVQWVFAGLRKTIQPWDQWCAEWSKEAKRYSDMGDKALADGHRVTAGSHYIRAALYYHWATFLFVHDQKQFVGGMEAMAACWKKAAPLVDPPMELLDIPFEGVQLPGYLRK